MCACMPVCGHMPCVWAYVCVEGSGWLCVSGPTVCLCVCVWGGGGGGGVLCVCQCVFRQWCQSLCVCVSVCVYICVCVVCVNAA